MNSVRKMVVFPLMVLMLASSSAFAGQQHVVTPGDLGGDGCRRRRETGRESRQRA